MAASWHGAGDAARYVSPRAARREPGAVRHGAIVGPSVGPTLGGWLTDNFSWNDVFFINVVPGAIAAIIIFVRLRNPTDPRPMPVDAIGLGLLAVGLGSLQFILDEGQRNDWFSDGRIVGFALASVAGLCAFVIWELYGTKRPIVDLRAFKYRAIVAGSVLSLALGATLFGAIVILPQYTQGILGFTATLSGELIFARAIFIAIFTPFVARLAGTGRVDTRILLFVGFSMIGVAQFWLAAVTTTQSDFGALLLPAALGGIGISLLFTPIAIAVLGAVPPEVAPKAAAFQSLSLQLGGSLSTAALITLLARRNAFHQDMLAASATAANPALAALLKPPRHRARIRADPTAGFRAVVCRRAVRPRRADLHLDAADLRHARPPQGRSPRRGHHRVGRGGAGREAARI